jgi:uncharacterized membrane protein YdfJ with MMPL/SSD domain
VFRSILVPLKAVLGFILSLMATLGFTTLVIQHGKPNVAINERINPSTAFNGTKIERNTIINKKNANTYLVLKTQDHYLHSFQ